MRFKLKPVVIKVTILLSGCTFSSLFAASFPIIPEQNTRAFFVDTTVCSVVLKTSINAVASIQQGTPIDSLIGQPAICTSSVTGQAQVATGVRQVIGNGFRITGVSHSVTVIGLPTNERSELLLSAVFTLERPQATASAANNPPLTR
jgi:hypothetical protein